MPITTTARAIGIARQSHGDGESVAQQVIRIRDACKRDGIRLLEVIEEQDVSGGTPLAKRKGLRRAVELVEAGEADVVVGAYFDRLMRSLKVQAELVERVEAKGGRVLALDTGEVTNGSAGQWLSSTMLGAVAEYQRRTTAERVRQSQIDAVADGIPPWPNVTPGYRRRADRRYEPDPRTRDVVTEAFAMRADGLRVADVRSYLDEHGIKLSYHGVCHLLRSRVVLGEIHFGELSNPRAHEPIVDATTWRRVQERVGKRGRRPTSDRLLARQEILQCGTCGSQMVIGASNRWPYYRCNRVREDCPARASISARLIEQITKEQAQAIAADAQGRASAGAEYDRAVVERDRALAALNNTIELLDGREHLLSARRKLDQMTKAYERWRNRVDELAPLGMTQRVSLADWDSLTLDERRIGVRSTIESITVFPGKGRRVALGEIEVQPLGQQSARGAVEHSL